MNTMPHISIESSNQKGFSLIEVMIAMVILAVGVLGMAAMQIYAFHGNEFAWERTEAVTIGTQKLEELADDEYAASGLSEGTHTDTVIRQNGRQYDLEWTVTEIEWTGTENSNWDSKSIELTVFWDERGTERKAKFDYIVAKLEPYSIKGSG